MTIRNNRTEKVCSLWRPWPSGPKTSSVPCLLRAARITTPRHKRAYCPQLYFRFLLLFSRTLSEVIPINQRSPFREWKIYALVIAFPCVCIMQTRRGLCTGTSSHSSWASQPSTLMTADPMRISWNQFISWFQTYNHSLLYQNTEYRVSIV